MSQTSAAISSADAKDNGPIESRETDETNHGQNTVDLSKSNSLLFTSTVTPDFGKPFILFVEQDPHEDPIRERPGDKTKNNRDQKSDHGPLP